SLLDLLVIEMVMFFFFSSRRRHTRWPRDWSSDVCSSDLHPITVSLRTGQPCSNVIMGVHKPSGELTWIAINTQPLFQRGERKPRSEERRVGKECRSGWSREH